MLRYRVLPSALCISLAAACGLAACSGGMDSGTPGGSPSSAGATSAGIAALPVVAGRAATRGTVRRAVTEPTCGSNGSEAFVGLADFNYACASYSTVTAGYSNGIDSSSGSATIGGGTGNDILSGLYGTIAGGEYNLINGGNNDTISGGESNSVTANLGFVGSGQQNVVAATAGGIVAGEASSVTAAGTEGFIGGGQSNNEGGSAGAIVGGQSNTVLGLEGFVGTGQSNTNDGQRAAIVTGYQNGIGVNGYEGFIGGGDSNNLFQGGAIVGGSGNGVNGQYGFIGEGTGNHVTASDGFIGSGASNAVGGSGGFVGGGSSNSVVGAFGVAGGGQGNQVPGAWGAVGGGYGNKAGAVATVPGGKNNLATGEGSFAAGIGSTAGFGGDFVWSDFASGATALKATAANQFLARASGGVTFYSSPALASGVRLAAGSGTWSSLSDRNAKTGILPVSDDDILARVAALPISEWSYATERGVRHVGPMAQDFYAAFNVGEDDRHITSIDEDGVALAAIKALNARVLQRDAAIQSLQHRDAELLSRDARLQRQMTALAAKVAAMQVARR